ncbi:MAG: glycosyltransferase [Bacteroidota bacterium]
MNELSPKPPIDVVCALIWERGRLLGAQVPLAKDPTGRWEFPGGKLEAGESKTDGLRREIREELGIGIQVLKALPPVATSHPEKHIRLWPFHCLLENDLPQPIEHHAFRWLSWSERLTPTWGELDLQIVYSLRQEDWCQGIPWGQIALIMPVFNEASRIGKTLAPLVKLGVRAIAVDDASTDGSQRILRDYPIHVLSHSHNLGQGAALQTGMDYALQASDLLALVHFDADGQHHWQDLPALLAPILWREAQVVLGSRFMEGAETPGISLWRRALLKVAIWVHHRFTKLRLTDVHNGFRAFSPSLALKIKLRQNRMAHATEILVQLGRLDPIYREVPVKITYDAYSKSKGQSNWQAWLILADLVQAFFTQGKRTPKSELNPRKSDYNSPDDPLG